MPNADFDSILAAARQTAASHELRVSTEARSSGSITRMAGCTRGADHRWGSRADDHAAHLTDVVARHVYDLATTDAGEAEQLRAALRRVCDDAFSDGEGAMRSYLAATDVADDDPWGEHPDHPVTDWQYEVANGDTRSGYRAWVTGRVGNDT